MKQFDVEGMRKHLRLVIREAFDVARRASRIMRACAGTR